VPFLDSYSEFIYKRTYSRWNDEKGRRENWDETVERYFDFLREIIPSAQKRKLDKARQYVMQLKVMPSMRALWAAGAPLKNNNITGYNCSYVVVDNPKIFSDIMFILMCGTGVGFSVERQYVVNLPTIPYTLSNIEETVIFEDSREGWAEGYNSIINHLYSGKIPNFNLDKIRPEGSVLKTFGGRASGPRPLRRLIDFTINLFKQAKGRKLNSLECHDLVCCICDVVVAGGTRRSACISFSNLSDQRMKHAKDGAFWEMAPYRALANNSVAYTEKPDMYIFMEEWLSLARSGTGERGIFNREGAKKIVASLGRRNPEFEFGGNPCQPSDSLLLDGDKLRRIDDNGVTWKSWKTGIKEVLELTLNNGMKVKFTPEHKIMLSDGTWCQAKDSLGKSIKWGLGNRDTSSFDDKYIMYGFLFGDGSKCASGEGVTVKLNKEKETEVYDFLTKNCGFKEEVCGSLYTNIKNIPRCVTLLNKPVTTRAFPEDVLFGDSCTSASFLRGLFEANGSVNAHSQISLKSTNHVLIEKVQLLLASFGIESWAVHNEPKAIKWHNGTYISKESWNLQIAPRNSWKFKESIGFISNYKNSKIRKFSGEYKIKLKVLSIKSLGEKEVWDYSMNKEPHYNFCQGVIAHNCLEIILRPNEFCNLTEVVVRENDTLHSLCQKVRMATMLGCLQSTLTNFPIINEEFKKNCEEERLLGVSLTGVCDHPIIGNIKNKERIQDWLTTMKLTAIEEAEKWSNILGINMPAAITCVKPSGTVSQLVGSSSGIHTRYSPYYVRRVRVAKTDPMSRFLIDKGIPYNPEIGSTLENATTLVFDFYVKSPKSSMFRDDMSAIEQLEYWKLFQDYWCEHKPSVTIYVKDSEWLETGAWVYKNWDFISGVSFLPYDGGIYELTPFEEIDAKTYEEKMKTFPKLDFSELSSYEKSDMTEGSKEYACVGGVCEI